MPGVHYLKNAFGFSVSILVFLVLTTSASAQGFSTEYHIQYTIREDAPTRVSQEITLTNHLEDYYISDYTLTVEKEGVDNFLARDGGGEILPEITHEDGKAIVRLPLNRKVIGAGSTQTLVLTYEDDSITQEYGQIWEVVIPRIRSSGELRSYVVTIDAPLFFGEPSLIHPSPVSRLQTEDRQRFSFDGQAMQDFGALLTFGNTQYYSYTLKYHLKNPHKRQVQTKIALPPDIDHYQRIYYSKLNPLPTKIEVDRDGNYLALYELSAEESLEVSLQGMVKTSPLLPERFSEQTEEDIPAEIKEFYLGEQPYWPVQDKMIRSIAAEQTSGKTGVYEQAQAIYDYVSQNLVYSQDRLSGEIVRFGAKRALEEPEKAVCMEYTDLMITLARAAGVPAREVDGYAFTPDAEYLPTIGDVLHAWVEVYIPPHGWVPVDPTWGSTTRGLDYFNHFDPHHVYFSIRGVDSEWPYPAGAYKISPQQVGDINVKTATEEEIETYTNAKPDFRIKESLPRNYLSGVPLKGKLTIRNNGSVSLLKGSVRLRLSGEGDGEEYPLKTIPPFGEQEVQFSLGTVPLWQALQTSITATVDFENVSEGEYIEQQVTMRPLIFYGLLFVVFCTSLVSGLYVYRRKQAHQQSQKKRSLLPDLHPPDPNQ